MEMLFVRGDGVILVCFDFIFRFYLWNAVYPGITTSASIALPSGSLFGLVASIDAMMLNMFRMFALLYLAMVFKGLSTMDEPDKPQALKVEQHFM